MPIDDVDYLKSNSIRQSYMFLVDSADRDRSVYPTPSQYVVEFTKPFQQVVGFEVVHASVPRTMYNIDAINNRIAFFIHDSSIVDFTAIEPVIATIPAGEYSIQTLIVALNKLMYMHVNNDTTAPYVSITAESTTNPPDIESKIRFRCPYPFVIDMQLSTCAESLGFDEYTQTSERLILETIRRYENPIPDINRRFYHSVDISPSTLLGAERTVFEGPRGVIRKASMSGSNIVAQRFRLDAKGYLKQVYAALYVANVTTNSIGMWEVRHSISDGSGTAPDFNRPPIVNETIAVSFTDGTLSDAQPPPPSTQCLEADVYYWIVFYSHTDGIEIFYNDIIATETTMLLSSNNGSTWSSVDNNGVFFNLALKIIVADEYHVLTAPGMYSLIGPKYLVMRCQEIEEHSFRSLAFSKHHIGIGMIKLGVVGYSDNRMDFNKVPLREFHPIGKLTRLTLRFELPSGELYDFKGVNHTITFAIHYLEPMARIEFQKSILNPNYNGNFIDYMYHQDDQEEESDDQEEEYDRDYLEDYRRRENYYLPENRLRRDVDFVNRMPEFKDIQLEDDEPLLTS